MQTPQQNFRRPLSSWKMQQINSFKPQMNKLRVTGIFDQNGNPIQNAFIQIPSSQRQILNPGSFNNFTPKKQIQNNLQPIIQKTQANFKSQIPQNNISLATRQKNLKILNSMKPGDPKRKLFLESLGGALGSVTGGVGNMIGGVTGAVTGEDGGGGISTGAVVGIGAAGAGMAARKARKDKFHFDKTQFELKINFEEFRKQYVDFEYYELVQCNRLSARINGSLSSIEKNMVYRVNNRILEMIDAVA